MVWNTERPRVVNSLGLVNMGCKFWPMSNWTEIRIPKQGMISKRSLETV